MLQCTFHMRALFIFIGDVSQCSTTLDFPKTSGRRGPVVQLGKALTCCGASVPSPFKVGVLWLRLHSQPQARSTSISTAPEHPVAVKEPSFVTPPGQPLTPSVLHTSQTHARNDKISASWHLFQETIALGVYQPVELQKVIRKLHTISKHLKILISFAILIHALLNICHAP